MPQGSCICGDISYSFSEEPMSKVVCHCLLCRKLTGSAFLTGWMLNDPAQQSPNNDHDAPAPAREGGAFTWKSKTNAQLKISSGAQESGVTMIFHGCASCPSTLFKTCPGGFPGALILLAGSLDGDEAESGLGTEGGAPQAELWVQHRLPWVQEIGGAKQCQAFT